MDGRAPHGFRCHTTHFSATRWVIYAKVTTSRETDFGATDDNQVLESKLDRKSRKSLLGIEEDSLIEETWEYCSWYNYRLYNLFLLVVMYLLLHVGSYFVTKMPIYVCEDYNVSVHYR
jgi:hypothetical protein